MDFKKIMDLRNRLSPTEPWQGECSAWGWKEVSEEQKELHQKKKKLKWSCPPQNEKAVELFAMLDDIGRLLRQEGLKLEAAQYSIWLDFINLKEDCFNLEWREDFKEECEEKGLTQAWKAGIYPIMETLANFVNFDPKVINETLSPEVQEAWKKFAKEQGIEAVEVKRDAPQKRGKQNGVEYALMEARGKGVLKGDDWGAIKECVEMFNRLERDAKKMTPYGKDALFFMPSYSLMMLLALIAIQKQKGISLHEAWIECEKVCPSLGPVPSEKECQKWTRATPKGFEEAFANGLEQWDDWLETAITVGGVRSGPDQWMLMDLGVTVEALKLRQEDGSIPIQKQEDWERYRSEYRRRAVDHLNTLGLRTGVLKQARWMESLLDKTMNETIKSMSTPSLKVWSAAQKILGKPVKVQEVERGLLERVFKEYKSEWDDVLDLRKTKMSGSKKSQIEAWTETIELSKALWGQEDWDWIRRGVKKETQEQELGKEENKLKRL